MKKIHLKSAYITLMSVMLVGAVGLAIAVTLLILGLDFTRTSLSYTNSLKARGLANACAEEALQQIHDNNSYSSPSNLTLSGSTCSYTITSGGGAIRTIQSTGVAGSDTRKVKVITSQLKPKILLTSWQEVADF